MWRRPALKIMEAIPCCMWRKQWMALSLPTLERLGLGNLAEIPGLKAVGDTG